MPAKRTVLGRQHQLITQSHFTSHKDARSLKLLSSFSQLNNQRAVVGLARVHNALQLIKVGIGLFIRITIRQLLNVFFGAAFYCPEERSLFFLQIINPESFV